MNSDRNSATIRGPGMPSGFATDAATKVGLKKTAIKRRKELWESVGSEVSENGSPKPQGGRPTEFASEIAAKIGADKSGINRALRHAETLGADLARTIGNRRAQAPHRGQHRQSLSIHDRHHGHRRVRPIPGGRAGAALKYALVR